MKMPDSFFPDVITGRTVSVRLGIGSGKIQYYQIQIPGGTQALTARMSFSFDLILVILAIKN